MYVRRESYEEEGEDEEEEANRNYTLLKGTAQLLIVSS